MQSYFIYQKNGKTVARGRVEGDELARDTNASVVIQHTLQVLADQAGGELQFESGVYEIDTSLYIPSNVKISGSGYSTVFKQAPSYSADSIFLVEGQQHVRFVDFTCQGLPDGKPCSGIILDDSGLCEIHGVYARDFSQYGFWVRNNSFMNRLVDNLTSGNHQAGTFIDRTEWSRGGRFIPNNLIGCFSYAEEGHGFEFHRAICQDVVGCVAYQMKGHGYYMRDSTSNLISGCRAFMGFQNGIMIENTYEMNISSNIIGWNWGHCLELDRCTWATVSANEFIDPGGRQDPKYGIYMHGDTKGIQVSANTIFAWWDNQIMQGGIYEAEGCQENQITDNNINYYKDEAVFAGGMDGRVDFNLGIREPYAPPAKAPFLPKVKREDIVLLGNITDPSDAARAFLDMTRW